MVKAIIYFLAIFLMFPVFINSQNTRIIPQNWANFYVHDLTLTEDSRYLLFSDRQYSFKVVDYKRKWLLFEIEDISNPIALDKSNIAYCKNGKLLEHNLETNTVTELNIPTLKIELYSRVVLTKYQNSIFLIANNHLYIFDRGKRNVIDSLDIDLDVEVIHDTRKNSILFETTHAELYLWDINSNKTPVKIASFLNPRSNKTKKHFIIQDDNQIVVMNRDNFKIIGKDSLKTTSASPVYFNENENKVFFTEFELGISDKFNSYDLVKKNKFTLQHLGSKEKLILSKSNQLNDTTMLVYSVYSDIFLFNTRTAALINAGNAPWTNGYITSCITNLNTNEIIFGVESGTIHIFNYKLNLVQELSQYNRSLKYQSRILENQSPDCLTTKNCFYNYCTNTNVTALKGDNYLLHSEKTNKDFLVVYDNDTLSLYEFPTLSKIVSYYIGKYLDTKYLNKLYIVNDSTVIIDKGESIGVVNEKALGYRLKRNWRFSFSNKDFNVFNQISPTRDSIAVGVLRNGEIEKLYDFFTDYKKFNFDPIKDSIDDEYFINYKLSLQSNRLIASPNGEWIIAYNNVDSAHYTLVNTLNPTLNDSFYIPEARVKSEYFIDDDGNYELRETILMDSSLFPAHINLLEFIPWEKNHVLCTNEKSTIILDLISKKRIKSFPFACKSSNDIRFDKELKQIELLFNDGKENILIDKNYNSVTKYKIENDNNTLTFLNADLYCDNPNRGYVKKIYNSVNGHHFTCFQIDHEYLIVNPKGYYMSSNPKLNQILFEIDNKYFSFEQLDLKFNRPDLIISELSCNQPKEIEAYKRAYLKRLKKMGFTEEMLKEDFHLPELNIKNFERLPSIVDSAGMEIDLEIKDSKYNLDRINIYINDVPVYGSAGIDLRKLNTQSIQKTISLQLAEGLNKIQVSVLNQAGAESYKETAYVTYQPKKSKKPDLYLVTIGDSKYKDSRYDLTYASKDAEDIKNAFKHHTAYDHVFSFIYTNEKVTKGNILQLKEKLKQARRDDVVMIMVAGHGVLDKNLDYFLATYDMDFNNPAEKGIPYEQVESLVDGIEPLKKVIFLDACHSGEVDKEEVEQLAHVSQSNDEVKFRSAGAGIQKKNLGLKTTSELMSELFTDLRKGTGATVISSAGGAEYAMESKEWKNGLFTYCFLHGLKDKAADENKDGKIMLSELQNYLRKEVTKLSNGAQQPNSRIENLSMDFRVW